MAITTEQRNQLEAILASGLNPQDLLDVAQEILDLKKSTGWGMVVVRVQAGEVEEIETTRRRKPKVERRSK